MGKRGPKPKVKDITCPNPDCPHHNKKKKDTVVRNGSYRTINGKVNKYHCTACGSHFTLSRDTMSYGLSITDDQLITMVKMLVAGKKKSSVAREMRVKPETIDRWLRQATKHIDQINMILRGDIDVYHYRIPLFWAAIKDNDYQRWREEYRRVCSSTFTIEI